MSDGDDTPDFKGTVGDRSRSWHMTSEFAEYDAVHFVAGALQAGADSVTIERVDE